MRPGEFGAQLEGYFGKRYTAVQRDEIKRWASKHTDRALELVYRSVVSEERFLPLIAGLNAHALKVYEGYPELDTPRTARGDRQITDDAGWTPTELEENLRRFRTIAGRVASAKRVTCGL